MVAFAYVRPRSLAEAVASGAGHRSDGGEPGVDFFAGGTDLMQLLGEHLRSPARIVDISALPGLAEIEVRARSLRLGSLVKMSDAADHPVVRTQFTVVAEALLASASPAVRNMATLGGNLLQRTRCGYFRDRGAPCEKREPGTGCPALTGQNRNHAILGTSERCIATYAGDLANALLVLDAKVEIAGPGGSRTLPLVDLHRVPGDTPSVESHLAPGELLVAIELPAVPSGWRSHYLKVRDRASFEWSIASAAVLLEVHAGVVREARIAVGGVATKPWRVPHVRGRAAWTGHHPDPLSRCGDARRRGRRRGEVATHSRSS